MRKFGESQITTGTGPAALTRSDESEGRFSHLLGRRESKTHAFGVDDIKYTLSRLLLAP
jgi:hypothetical protein